MKPVFALAQAYLKTSFRERNSLFWFWLFPLLLLALLGSIFGGVERGQMEFSVAVVDLDRGSLSTKLVGVVHAAAEAHKSPLLFVPLQHQEELLAEAKRAVQEGRVSAVLVIPMGFSDQALDALRSPKKPAVSVEIWYRRGEAGSSTAASVLAELVEEFGQMFLVQAGLLRTELPLEMRKVGGEARAVTYVEFVLPGVILMALFISGIFNVPSAILFTKEAGILRRYFAAPLSGSQYLAGLALSSVTSGAIQVAAVWALGRFGFGARLPLLRPQALAFLFLAFGTALGLGFLISALARTYQGAMALANLLNLPLQFLGGLYFPVTDVPGPLRAMVAINPLTHLAEGLRAALGLGTSSFSAWANLFVPLFWLSGCAVLAILRIRLSEAR